MIIRLSYHRLQFISYIATLQDLNPNLNSDLNPNLNPNFNLNFNPNLNSNPNLLKTQKTDHTPNTD